MLNRLIQYIKESRIELMKVTWLSRQEVVQYTITVVVVSAALALFLGAVDFLFSFILTRFVL